MTMPIKKEKRTTKNVKLEPQDMTEIYTVTVDGDRNGPSLKKGRC